MKKKAFVEYLDSVETNRSPNGMTFYIDQAKFYDKPDLRLKWVLKGQEAVVPTQRSGRLKMLMYGAYSPQVRSIHVEEVLEETSEITASFFLALRALYPHRRLDIVLDNARWHYGDDVKDIARRYAIHLHYLPAYSPDLNAIEPLWQWARQEITYNTDYPSFVAKKHALNTFFHTVAGQPAALYARLVRRDSSLSCG